MRKKTRQKIAVATRMLKSSPNASIFPPPSLPSYYTNFLLSKTNEEGLKNKMVENYYTSVLIERCGWKCGIKKRRALDVLPDRY